MEDLTKQVRRQYIYLMSEIDELYHQVAVKLGMSDSIVNILYTICEFGEGCSQSDICKLSGISRQTINSAVRRLEQDDLVYLKPGTGKNMCLYLTDKGKALVKEKIVPLIVAEDAVLNEWSEADKQELLRLTRKYMVELQEKLNFLLK